MSFRMTANEPTKQHEQRLRRMTEREGLILKKSRRRDPNALDYGCYWLIDPSSNVLIYGSEWGTSLDDIEAWLTSDKNAAARARDIA